MKISNFKFQILFWSTVIFASCILNGGCQKEKKQNNTNNDSEAIPVKSMKVEFKQIIKTLDYVGSIRAQDEAQIFPKVTGKIIEKLKEDGSDIKKGETIAYIDRDEVGLEYEKAPVESSLDGIIGRVYVDKGTSVTPQTAIALVIDINNVEISLDIPEKFLPLIAINQTADISVDSYPNEKFTGTVSKISPVVDKDTRTAPIELVIPNKEHRLKPGMYARARLGIEKRENSLVIIKEAILGTEPNLYVYVSDNGIAHAKKIKVGIRQDNEVEIKEGLKEGDNVIIMGQQKLNDGAKIEVVSK